MATDTYGTPLIETDMVVFSWAGTLYKGIIERIRPVRSIPPRYELTIRPLNADGEAYETTAKVKCSYTTIKING
jgi:hypothetical protein